MKNAMKTSVLKKEIHDAIDNTEDNDILEAVFTILKKAAVESDIDEPSGLTTAQRKELEKRLELHNSGKEKYYTIDQVKKAFAKAIKK